MVLELVLFNFFIHGLELGISSVVVPFRRYQLFKMAKLWQIMKSKRRISLKWVSDLHMTNKIQHG